MNQKQLPRISIVIPTFNAERYIRETLKSIENQNYSNLELIIIDGLSTDKTISIVNDFNYLLPIIISEKDYGLNHAVNKGVLISTGEYINWLNADDYYLENALNKVGEFLTSNPHADLVYGDIAQVDENGQFLCWHGAIPYDLNKLLHVRNYIPCQATFFKRSTISFIGLFDTNLKWCGDWDMWKRFAVSEKYNICFLNEKLAAWRLHSNTITSGNHSSKEMYLQSLENFKSTRKYSKKFISQLELKQIPFLIVGFLRLRKTIKYLRNKFSTKYHFYNDK